MKIYTIPFQLVVALFYVLGNTSVSTGGTVPRHDKRSSKEQLIAVVALIRHGKRAPSKSILYPKYTFNESQWPNGHGELIDDGILQQFANGQAFRQRYDGLCQREIHFEREIMILSSKVKRTLISSIAFLEGFMQHSGSIAEDTLREIKGIDANDIMRHTKKFLPNIYNIKMVPDLYLRSIDICRNTQQRMARNFMVDNGDIQKFESTHLPFVRYVRNVTGIEEKNWNFNKMVVIWDVLDCTESAGYELPAWTRTKVSEIRGMEAMFANSPKTVKDVIKACATKFYMESIKGNDTLQRLTIGLLAHEILERFRDDGQKFRNYMKLLKDVQPDESSYGERVRQGVEGSITVRSKISLREFERRHWLKFPKHFYIYMAHDFTLSALMTLFNVSFDKRPASASSFIMELIKVPKNSSPDGSTFRIKFFNKPNEGSYVESDVRKQGTVEELREELKNKLTSDKAYVRDRCAENFLQPAN